MDPDRGRDSEDVPTFPDFVASLGSESERDRAVSSDLSVRGFIRRSSGLSAVSLLTAALAVPTTLLAARWVGPIRYGRAQYILLFYFYAALVRTGVFEGGLREFIHEAGVGDLAKGQRSRNIGLSWEIIASVIPGLLMVPLALLFSDSIRVLGFVLAPVAVLLSSACAFFGGMFIAEQRLRVVGRAWLIRAIVLNATVLTGVHLFGAGAIFVGPIIADCTAVVLFATSRPLLRVAWIPDRLEGRRLLAAGFPLGLAAIVYWMYRMVGSTTIALSQNAKVLGVYAFAVVPVTVLTRSIAMAEGVLTPALWTAMASDQKTRAWVDQAARVTVGLAAIAAFGTNLAQAGFGPVVAIVVPGFKASVSLFEVLSLSVFPLAVAAVPVLVLTATTVNRQTVNLVILFGGLVVNVVANAVVVLLGGGSVFVAWNDVWVQCLLLVVLFEVSAPAMDRGRTRFRMYRDVVMLATCMVGIESVLHFMFNGDGSRLALVVRLLERVGFVVGSWGLIALAARRSRWTTRRLSVSRDSVS